MPCSQSAFSQQRIGSLANPVGRATVSISTKCPPIAIYHATVKTFSRSKGRSATAAAAYRAGCRLADTRTGLVHDYRRKGGVVSARQFAPPNTPEWAADPTRLWDKAEQAETRVNSRVARELEVALPSELDAGQREALAHEFAQMLVDRYRVAVLAAIHEPSKQGDARNHHVHLLMTTRALGPDGFGAKVRVLDDKRQGPIEVAGLRAVVSATTNRHLAAAGHSVRIDHRTLEEQAGGAAMRGNMERVVTLSRIPSRQRGNAATALVRRGAYSHRALTDRHISEANADLAAFGRQRAYELGLLPMGMPAPTDDQAARHSRRARPIVSNRSTRMSGSRLIGEAAIGVRAVGRDAKLLNEQATRMQEGLRAARDNARKAVEAMEESVRNAEERAEAALRAWRERDEADARQSYRPSPRPYRHVPYYDEPHPHSEKEPAHTGLLPGPGRPSPRVRRPQTSASRGETRSPKTRRQWAEYRRAERATKRARPAPRTRPPGY